LLSLRSDQVRKLVCAGLVKRVHPSGGAVVQFPGWLVEVVLSLRDVRTVGRELALYERLAGAGRCLDAVEPLFSGDVVVHLRRKTAANHHVIAAAAAAAASRMSPAP
jgi:hypothetical protein